MHIIPKFNHIHPFRPVNLTEDMAHFHEQFQTHMAFPLCLIMALSYSTRCACERKMNFKDRAITPLSNHTPRWRKSALESRKLALRSLFRFCIVKPEPNAKRNPKTGTDMTARDISCRSASVIRLHINVKEVHWQLAYLLEHSRTCLGCHANGIATVDLHWSGIVIPVISECCACHGDVNRHSILPKC